MGESIDAVGSRSESQAGSRGEQLTGQVQQTVQQTADQARERAAEATEQVRSTVRSQVDNRTGQVAIQIHSTADDLRTVGEELRRRGQETPARLADQVAGQAERFAGYLRTNDADRILRDVENFGRRQPWAVIAGGLTVGFVASRFLKASSARRFDNQYRHTSTRSRSQLRSELDTTGYSSPAVHPGVSGSDVYAS